MTMSSELTPHSLLSHHDFVRSLARQLLTDEQAAEDVAQEVWVATQDTKAAPRAMRPWLAGVVRNVARQHLRSSSRRTFHEQRGAVSGAVPSAEDVLTRESLRARVVHAVLGLDEPLRAVVLLRYFEGLPPRRIATHQGIPVETIRTRLKRAHQVLRQRLADESPEGKERLHRGLAILAGGAPGILGTSGAVAVLAWTIPVLLVTAGVLSVLVWRQEATADQPSDNPIVHSVAVGESSPGGRKVADSPQVPSALSEATTPRVSPARLRSQVIDALGDAVPNALVTILTGLNRVTALQQYSDRTGNVFFEDIGERRRVRVEAAGYLPMERDLLELDFRPQGAKLILSGGRRAHVSGRIIDPKGASVTPSSVRIEFLHPGLPSQRIFRMPDWSSPTSLDGTFSIPNVPAGQSLGVFYQTESRSFRVASLPRLEPGEERHVEITLPRETQLRLRFIDERLDEMISPLDGGVSWSFVSDEVGDAVVAGRKSLNEKDRTIYLPGAGHLELTGLLSGFGPFQRSIEVSDDSVETFRMTPMRWVEIRLVDSEEKTVRFEARDYFKPTRWLSAASRPAVTPSLAMVARPNRRDLLETLGSYSEVEQMAAAVDPVWKGDTLRAHYWVAAPTRDCWIGIYINGELASRAWVAGEDSKVLVPWPYQEVGGGSLKMTFDWATSLWFTLVPKDETRDSISWQTTLSEVELTKVPSGHYTLWIDSAESLPPYYVQEIVIEDNGQLDLGRIDLVPHRELILNITDQTGTPVADASVSVFREDLNLFVPAGSHNSCGGAAHRFRAFGDPEGHCHLHVSAKNCVLHVDAPGFEPTQIAVREHDDTLTVSMTLE